MIKTFDYCYKVANDTENDSFRKDQIKIETNGNPSDWYAKLFRELNLFRIKHDRKYPDNVISEIRCWDNDKHLYHITADEYPLIEKGMYFIYVCNETFPDGIWKGQYPDQAWKCNGIFSKDINCICDDLDHKEHTLLSLLFPDYPHQKVQVINAITKDKAIKAVEDASKALECLDLMKSKYELPVPDAYQIWIDDIFNRLASVREWIKKR